jgi:hypothetical protein
MFFRISKIDDSQRLHDEVRDGDDGVARRYDRGGAPAGGLA